MRPTERAEQGFTLIEVLVAMVLFAVMVSAVLAPLTGFFGLSRQSSVQMDGTARAQTALEQVRGQWQDRSPDAAANAQARLAYDRTCVTSALPSGVTVTVQNLNFNAAAETPPTGATRSTWTINANCTLTTATLTTDSEDANGVAVPIKRVTVAAAVGNATSTLTLDLARPQ